MAAPSPTTIQNGVTVVIETRPKFTGYINTDFPEQRKADEAGNVKDETGRKCTLLWNDLTDEVSAKLVVLPPESGDPVLPEIGDTLTEAFADTVTGAAVRKWSVMEVGRQRKAGQEVLLDVKLQRSENVTLV